MLVRQSQANDLEGRMDRCDRPSNVVDGIVVLASGQVAAKLESEFGLDADQIVARLDDGGTAFLAFGLEQRGRERMVCVQHHLGIAAGRPDLVAGAWEAIGLDGDGLNAIRVCFINRQAAWQRL